VNPTTYASITHVGQLVAKEVPSDQECTLRAAYGGKEATKTATIKNVETHIIWIESENPSADVWIEVSPSDKNGDAGSNTFFERTYEDGMRVTLTAPERASGNDFLKWLKDDDDYSINRQITVTVSGDATYIAVYRTNETGTGLLGRYYDRTDFRNLKMTRADAKVDFDWGGGSPHRSIHPDYFAVKWIGQVEPLFTGTYRFYTVSDDGVRLWVDGRRLINDWKIHGTTEQVSKPIMLTAGQKYSIRLEYFDARGGARVRLLWSSSEQPKQIIPQSQLYPPEP